jgi:hypothetical protein
MVCHSAEAQKFPFLFSRRLKSLTPGTGAECDRITAKDNAGWSCNPSRLSQDTKDQTEQVPRTPFLPVCFSKILLRSSLSLTNEPKTSQSSIDICSSHSGLKHPVSTRRLTCLNVLILPVATGLQTGFFWSDVITHNKLTREKR